MNKTLLTAAKAITYLTVIFLLPFWFLAYFVPMAEMNITSIGLVPEATMEIVGLSNLRGSIGGLRLGIILLLFLGAFYKKPDLLLGGALVVAVVSLGRFISLVADGWELISFITATGEVMIVAGALYLKRSFKGGAY